ncbi:MAG: helix-turn-helix domain-containing protein [Anaerolineae bacterium]
MSLGDYLRYLRAMRGGPTPWEIAEAAGLDSPRLISEIEQRYREIGDDETLEKLAAYYQVPVEELRWRWGRSRKAFTAFAEAAMKSGQPVLLHLRLGEDLAGRVLWWDLGAIGLEPQDGTAEIVVQRHIIDDWELLDA